MNQYVLDTSALLAYVENEAGTNQVEELLRSAIDGNVALFISTVSCIELFYISWQEQGKEIARERLKLLSQLMIFQEPLDGDLVELVGEIKATKMMSFADCCVAGLAKLKHAVLVHKDPEFEQIEAEILQLKLPYKQKIKKN